MSTPGPSECQCVHPYYCHCQSSRWPAPAPPLHAAPPSFHHYYPSQYMAQSTPAFPTALTLISAQAAPDSASGPSQLPQINSVPFPLGDATALVLNTQNPNGSQPRKRRRANATSSSDRNKKKAPNFSASFRMPASHHLYQLRP